MEANPLPPPPSPPPAPLQNSSAPVASPPLPTPPRRGGVWKIISGILALLVVGGGGAAAYYFLGGPTTYTEAEVLQYIREAYVPNVVMVACMDEEGGEEAGHGSGIYYWNEDGGVVETNAHVVVGSDGAFHGCNIYFPHPDDGGFYNAAYFAGAATLHHNKIAVVNGTKVSGIDFAEVYLTAPRQTDQGIDYPWPPAQAGFGADLGPKWKDICHESGSALQLGDKLVALGYPGVGGNSLTFTEGVVSGFRGDNGEVVKSSVSINQGNSGGIAIDAEQGCLIGVPTWTTTDFDGSGSNLGLILSTSFIRDFIAGVTDEATYQPDPDVRDFVTHSIDRWDVALQYPASWKIEENEDGTMITFTAPPESALDLFQENVSLTIIEPFDLSLSAYANAFALALLSDNPDGSVSEPRVFTSGGGLPTFGFGYTLGDGIVTVVLGFRDGDKLILFMGEREGASQLSEAYGSIIGQMGDSLVQSSR